MIRHFPAASLLALSLAAAPALAQRPAGAAAGQDARAATEPAAKSPSEFQEARPLVINASSEPEAFEFELNGFTYHIRRNGNGWRRKGQRTRRFNLRLDSGELGRVFFADYDGRLLLVCDVGELERGGGFVTLLEQPSMRARWRQTYHPFNAGAPLREGRALYVTGSAFIARLDLETGEFAWQHDLRVPDEGRGVSFVLFETPRVAGETVLFRDLPVYNPPHTLVVRKKTGEIIRIE